MQLSDAEIVCTKNYFSGFRDKDFRPGQLEAVKFALESRKPVVAICGPTGFGKSLVGMCVGKLATENRGKFAYAVSSKQLQNQLISDFPEAMEMRGRNNFECNRYDHMTAAQCTHSQRNPCPCKKVACQYEIYKRRVAAHPIQVLNYSYLLYESNFAGMFSNYPILIVDEGDVLERTLMDFIELSVTKKDLEHLGLKPPDYKTACENGVLDWQRWAGEKLLPAVVKQITTLENGIEVSQDRKIASLLQHYKLLGIRAQLLAEYVDQSWILEIDVRENEPYKWRSSPAWVTPDLAQMYLFRHAEKVVLMSATFPTVPVLAKLLGLNQEDIDYIELPSLFPVENRCVYLDPVADMRNGTIQEDLPKMLARIEQILNKHPKEKGIIHAVSWRLTDAIMSIKNHRLVTHSTEDKEATVKRFKETTEPMVFVSPSSDRGLDLPDDQCRFVIMAKAPFAHVKSKRVEKRRYETKNGLGKLWYVSDCAQEIVQACGRGVRHKDDYCVTYLLDKALCELVTDRQSLFPRYWKQAVEVL